MIRARAEPDRRNELVAYFCAEYAVDQRLPIYAGGLGVLAGDHLKAAGDLGLPLVAVGLMYRGGYFAQQLDGEGRQRASPEQFDPETAGLTPVLDPMRQELRIRIPMAAATIHARLWRKEVGPIPLFLLDTDIEENAEDDRRVTARLYDSGHDMRLRQEIVLGIGGVRAIRTLALQPSVWHVNEGHAAFMVLERMRERIAWGHSFGAALETVAAGTVFTTHTPVAAGHDVYSYGQLRHWLGDYMGGLHVTERRLFALGANGAGDHRFNMTALAIRASRHRNAVSRVHRGVAARMESYVWPQVPADENPVGYVTNGVHLPTFVAPVWRELLDAHVPGWRRRPLTALDTRFVDALDDRALVASRAGLRAVLVMELRARLAAQHRRNGTPTSVVEDATDLASLGPLPGRNAVAAALIGELALALAEFAERGMGAFAAEWRDADALVDRPVRVLQGELALEGMARGVDDDGALLLEIGGGRHRILSGEVSVRPVR